MQSQKAGPQVDRRGFFKKSLALVFGGIAALVPVVAGWTVLTNPLRRKGDGGVAAIRITTLDSLPADGIPRKFPVIASKTDAWNKFTNLPVGAVYLRRTSDGKVDALNVVCPHAGCPVDYSTETKQYLCPCHKSSFQLNGAIASAGSPSKRGLDTLDAEVRDGVIWVKFQNFVGGEAGKIPVS
jgi:menaquinol-cytochrome c reductase iron-sulfur subunit